jgi:hypothetical protein
MGLLLAALGRTIPAPLSGVNHEVLSGNAAGLLLSLKQAGGVEPDDSSQRQGIKSINIIRVMRGSGAVPAESKGLSYRPKALSKGENQGR